MSVLHLLRHAKSAWDDALDDHERPLSRRGSETARRLGGTLPVALGRLDLVLCSSALRTRQTLDLVIAGFRPRPQIAIEDTLYLASAARLLARLCLLGSAETTVLVVGHNPGLHELAVALAAMQSPHYHALADGKFPTAARASLEIAVPWAALGSGGHNLLDYVTTGSSRED